MFKLRDGTRDQDRSIYMYIHQKWNMLDEPEWKPLWETNRRLLRATNLKYAHGNFLPANRIVFCLDAKDATWIWSHLHKGHTVKFFKQEEFFQGMVYSLYTKIIKIGTEERCQGRMNKKQIMISLVDTEGTQATLQLVDEEMTLAKLMAEGEHLIVYNPFLAPTDGLLWIGQETAFFIVAHKDISTSLPITPSQEIKTDIDISRNVKRLRIADLKPGMTGGVLVGRVSQVFPAAASQMTHARPPVESMKYGMRLVQEGGQVCDVTLVGSLGTQSLFLPGHLVVLENARTFASKTATLVVLDSQFGSQLHNISLNRGILASPPLRTIHPLSELGSKGNIYAKVTIISWKPCGWNGMFALLHKPCHRKVNHGQDGVDRCSWCNVVIDFVQDTTESIAVQWTLLDEATSLVCDVLAQAAEDLVQISVSEVTKLSSDDQKLVMDQRVGTELEVSLSIVDGVCRVDQVGQIIKAAKH